MKNPWKTHMGSMGFLWVQNKYGQKLSFFGHFYLFLDQNSRFVDHHSFGPGEKIIGRPIICPIMLNIRPTNNSVYGYNQILSFTSRKNSWN